MNYKNLKIHTELWQLIIMRLYVLLCTSMQYEVKSSVAATEINGKMKVLSKPQKPILVLPLLK